MNDPVHILVVEDLKTDFELAQYEIRKSVKGCVFQQVETGRDFLQALEIFRPDVILSDYSLPRFDGMKALKLALEHAPLTPFIIWTGSLSEDVAVECMKAGANNYILKENIKRLGPAVLHALEERHLILERKETEDRLRRSESKYRTLAENSLQGIAIFQQQKIVYVNPAMCASMGYTKEELLAMSSDQILATTHLDDRTLSKERAKKRIAGKSLPSNQEVRIIRKDGAIRWIQTFTTSIEHEGQPAILSTSIDITERKQADEKLQASERRFRALIENSLDNISLLAEDGTLLWENPGVNRNLGYEQDEFVGRNIFELMHPDDREWTTNTFANLLKDTGAHQEGIFRLRHQNGTWRWIEAVATNLLNEPSVGAIVINYRDITERKQSEIEVEQRNDDLGLLNAINEAVIRGDGLNAIVKLLGKEMSRIFSSEGTMLYMLSPDDKFLTLQQYEMPPALNKKIEQLIGGTIPLVQIPIQEDGIFRKVLGSAHGIITDDPEEIQKGATEFFETYLLSHASQKLTHDLVPQLYDLLNVRSVISMPLISNGKTIGLLNVTSSKIFPADDLKRIENIGRQLTAAIQHQQANEKIQKSEEFLQSIQNALSASIAIMDKEGTIVQVNSAWRKFGELNGLMHPQSGIGLNYLDICDSATGPFAEEASFVASAIRDVISGRRREARIEYPCHSPKEKRWFILHVTKFEDRDQTWVVLAHENISERKQSQTALQESEKRYRSLFEDVPVAIWEEDFSEVKKYLVSLKQQGVVNFRDYFTSHPEAVVECAKMIRILDVNNTALRMYEAGSKEDLISETTRVLSFGEQEHNLDDFIIIAEGGTSNGWEGTDETLTGRPIEISLNWSVVPGYENDFSKVIVTTTDVTERQLAENELRTSEERFRQLADNIQEVFWITDVESKTDLYLSPAYENLWGRPVEEQYQDQGVFLESIRPEDRPLVLTSLEEQLHGKRTEIEYRITRPDGSVRWVWDRAFPIFDQTGKVNRVTGIAADVTERKQAENALQEAETKYRNLVERLPVLVYTSELGTNGKWTYVSPQIETLLGFTAKEWMADPGLWYRQIHPNDRDRQEALEEQAWAEKKSYDSEYRIFRSDGSEIWIRDIGYLLPSLDGGSPFVQGVLMDVTDRKQAEETLRARDELLYESQKISRLGHYDLDIMTGIWESSEILDDVLGIDKNYSRDIEGWGNLVHPDQRDEMINYFTQNVLGDQSTFDREYEIVRKSDQQERWVHGLGRLEYDHNGNPVRMIGTIQDITARKKIEVESRRHLAELEALYENGLAVGRLLDLREIGERIIHTFTHHLSWHHVTIRILKEESDELELVAFSLPHMNEEERHQIEQHFASRVNKVGQGMSGWVVQTANPIRTGNVHDYPQYVDIYEGIQSGLYMPLMVGERVIGVISVESEKPDAFSFQDERLLATLANQAAIAFENARLYQSAQQELSERERAEEALRASETHYRELADSITDIFFELDHELRYSHWNKASEALTGVAAKDALGKSMREIFGESEEQARIERIYREVLEKHIPKTFETILGLGNRDRYFEINAYPSTRGVAVVAKDVTDRKQSESIMQKRFELMEFSADHSMQELMQKTLDEISDWTRSTIGFFQFIKEDQVTPSIQIWSTDTFQQFHTSEEEIMHKPVDQAGVWADAIRQRRSVIHNEYESMSNKKGLPDGHASLARELVVPIIRNERILAVIGVGNKPHEYTKDDLAITERFADYAWDIIERKQMELALADERNQLAIRVDERTADLSRANSNLARALRVKDEFLANMSHELRTPLNAILGLSESLGEQVAGPLNEKQQRYVVTISESGHHLLSLINDILDLAKIEAGQVKLDINKVDVNSVCQASLRMIKQLAQNKKQEVVLDIDPDFGLIWTDERRLKQMVVNLLSNAIKFTPENGKIGLDVHGDRDENRVMISVWDTGIGIEDDDLARLFQPFMQLDSGLARETSGTGLGLALVAQMARLHGGGVSVTSKPGKGSRFTIALPWEPAFAVDTAAKLRQTGKFPAIKPGIENRPVILLIEDTQEVTMLFQDYLEMAGYTVVTAQDGIEGIAQAKRTHPALILMDLQMPRMDGFEATKRLRSEPDFQYTPIIAVTALAMSNDRERCLAAGMDEYLTKPVHLKSLVKMIHEFLSDDGTDKV